MSPPILLGQPRGDDLVIEVQRRRYPHATDYWDGNWIDATIQVHAGAFASEYEAQLRTEELSHLRTGLVRLLAELRGTATFESMEEWLTITIEGDGRGHFRARCVARDDLGGENELRFELEFDQTEIPSMLASLEATLAEFPIRGSPKDPS